MGKKRAKRPISGTRAVNPADPAIPPVRLLRIVTKSGELLREPTAVRDERPDPDSQVRNVRGWRGASPLDHIGSPQITREHRLAAARFAATMEAVAAAGYGHTARLPTGVPPGLSAAVVGTPESALRAVADHRAACQAVGKIGSALLLAVVVDGYSGARLARLTGGNGEVALGHLLATLSRLVEHYAEAGG